MPASGSGPGLVLCQEIFGLNGFVRQTAERLAEEGYVVLAPDLFWRQQPGIELTDGPDDMPRAFALYQGFDEDLGVRDIGSAVAALRALPEFKGGVGALGYCLGGKLAYLAACRCDVDGPWATTASASRTAWRKRPGCVAGWCCTSPSATASVLPRRASASWRRWAASPAWSCTCIRA